MSEFLGSCLLFLTILVISSGYTGYVSFQVLKHYNCNCIYIVHCIIIVIFWNQANSCQKYIFQSKTVTPFRLSAAIFVQTSCNTQAEKRHIIILNLRRQQSLETFLMPSSHQKQLSFRHTLIDKTMLQAGFTLYHFQLYFALAQNRTSQKNSLAMS